MKFTGFKVANCLRVNYPDGTIYAEIADDQDLPLLLRAAAAEMHNDCVLPPDLELRWTGGESRMAVRLVDSEATGETAVSGDFAGLGWQVEASYVDEGKHCWTVLTDGDDQEGVEQICAGLNDLLRPARVVVDITGMQVEIDELRGALTQCVASLDQLLPYLAKVPADVGLLNDALVAARPLLKKGS